MTPEYLELMRYQAVTANTKLYFGPDIPSLFLREGEGPPSALATMATKTKNAESATAPPKK